MNLISDEPQLIILGLKRNAKSGDRCRESSRFRILPSRSRGMMAFGPPLAR